MEFSGDICRNVNEGDPSQRSLDEDENVYANQETIRTQMSTQRKKEKGEIPGAGTIETKGYRVSVVSLGLLCVLLLIVIIVIVTKHDQRDVTRERDLFQERSTNITKERNQLQLTIKNLIKQQNLLREGSTNITKERDQLQVANNNLTNERDLFQERNTKLTTENHELRDIISNLTAEKNDLMDKNRNLTAEKEKLLNTFPIPQDWIRFGYSFYYISNNETTWSDGKQQCMDRGGNLVIIDSEEEQEFISGFQKRGWIGLTDVEGPWKWLDGELLKTGYWMEGEPNDYNGKEHCAEIFPDRTPLKNWNDNMCTERNSYFCEQPLWHQ
ncbi:asialoglycoprotein receptor 1-like [Sardina pilchardus]|uniref:asialoglycoprotein receptor 1-like n=1 Tax=Sardina pilchardus TaxID=27697 RepID=UPI002E0EAD56